MSKICPYCQKPLWHMQGLRRAQHYVKCAASADRSAKRQDAAGGLIVSEANDESAVAAKQRDAQPPESPQ